MIVNDQVNHPRNITTWPFVTKFVFLEVQEKLRTQTRIAINQKTPSTHAISLNSSIVLAALAGVERLGQSSKFGYELPVTGSVFVLISLLMSTVY